MLLKTRTINANKSMYYRLTTTEFTTGLSLKGKQLLLLQIDFTMERINKFVLPEPDCLLIETWTTNSMLIFLQRFVQQHLQTYLITSDNNFSLIWWFNIHFSNLQMNSEELLRSAVLLPCSHSRSFIMDCCEDWEYIELHF